jgi:hypothetical protein
MSSRQAPVVAIRYPPSGWSAEGLDALGTLALRALVDRDLQVRYHVRLTPEELLSETVLPSVGLLELERLELLAGAGTDRSLAALGVPYHADTIDRAVQELARAGLASVTRLTFVIGLPGESAEEALTTVREGVRLALMAGIPAIRFEWCLNAHGSILYRPAAGESAHDDPTAWRPIVAAIDLIRVLRPNLQITGPDALPVTSSMTSTSP